MVNANRLIGNYEYQSKTHAEIYETPVAVQSDRGRDGWIIKHTGGWANLPTAPCGATIGGRCQENS